MSEHSAFLTTPKPRFQAREAGGFIGARKSRTALPNLMVFANRSRGAVARRRRRRRAGFRYISASRGGLPTGAVLGRAPDDAGRRFGIGMEDGPIPILSDREASESPCKRQRQEERCGGFYEASTYHDCRFVVAPQAQASARLRNAQQDTI